MGELDRRDLLKWMAASAALAALPGCRPDQEAVPYVNPPAGITPGRPSHYATSWMFEGYAQPVVATCHAGRPTKLEGNPDHPASNGTTDAFTQIALQSLYDPDRSAIIRHQGAIATWDAFMLEIARRQGGWKQGGPGLAVLSNATTSPTMLRQMAALKKIVPGLRWHVFEPVGAGNRGRGLDLAFGRPVEAVPLLDKARLVVSFDDDPLGPGPWQTWNVNRWGDARRRGRDSWELPVLLAVEPVPTLTGIQARDRLAARPERVEALLAALGGAPVELSAAETRWLDIVGSALEGASKAALVTAGRHLPAEAHALVARLNAGSAAIAYRAPLAPRQPGLDDLMAAIDSGSVGGLLILDTNPVHAAPQFAPFLAKVPFSVHAGLHFDETAAACRWHVPLAHPLEDWSDSRAVDGSAVIAQPLVRPLFGGIGLHRLLGALLGRMDADPQAELRATWARLSDADWRRALAKGVIAGSAPAPLSLRQPTRVPFVPKPVAGLAVVIRPDAKVWDGRFANLPWAQEMGDPVTKVTWEHTATLSPATAARLGIKDGDLVRVGIDDRQVTAPACLLPGQAEDSVALTLGGGRVRAGRVGNAVGANAAALLPIAPGTIALAGGSRELARLQTTRRQFGHEVAKVVKGLGVKVEAKAVPEESLYAPWSYPGHAWAMVIDLDLCVGCNACMVACQAENNIPSVGRSEVAMGRAMHWIRIDRYHTGDNVLFQPVPCMHCEKAPCEVGCPVNAAVHSSEGINQQVYNRCIGTRTCEAYCPYEVRRFNFYDYAHTEAPSVEASRNPEVTVRSRGVMEKCTFCIQRIEGARIEAETAGLKLQGDSVVPACAQVCPSRAIHFGDLNSAQGAIRALRGDPRHYAMLAELNTWPRTTYLARIREG